MATRDSNNNEAWIDRHQDAHAQAMISARVGRDLAFSLLSCHEDLKQTAFREYSDEIVGGLRPASAFMQAL